ncbi:hypothetical protein BDN67DRAFT_974633 [Paxillus ammoniavirescens]|nr:hypothetical protein BDN67DRAFT_974633 [Paxillus ammoniavirescens]
MGFNDQETVPLPGIHDRCHTDRTLDILANNIHERPLQASFRCEVGVEEFGSPSVLRIRRLISDDVAGAVRLFRSPPRLGRRISSPERIT